MAGVSTSLALQDKFTATINKAVRGTNKILTSMKQSNVEAIKGSIPAMWRRTQAAARQTQIEIDKATQKTRQTTTETEKVRKKTEQTKNEAKKLSDTWGKVKGAIGAAVAASGVKQLMQLADKTTTTNARLSLMVDEGSVEDLNKKIFASAQRSRAAYQTTADAVSKMGIMAKDAFTVDGKFNADELIQFTELINKQFTIAGTEASGIDAAMLQLTQAMSSGVLRGEELNSIFEQAPTIIQTIADYLNVPIGQIRNMAAEGKITSTIVKNAMLGSAKEINERFYAMPMTYAQVWTNIQNILLKSFMPLIQLVGRGAQLINDNWDTIAPILVGIASGALAAAAAFGIYAAYQWIATGAAKAFFTTLLTNPLTWIALAIGLVVGYIYKWIQSVGGIKVAWLIACDKIYGAWDFLRIGLFKGINWVISALDNFGYGFAVVGTAILNFLGDTKVKALLILQDLTNGAIDIINGLIAKLNKIPGVSFEAIEKVTFGTQAALENEANKAARTQQLAEHKQLNQARAAERNANVKAMQLAADAAAAIRKTEINDKKAAALGTTANPLTGIDVGNVANVDKVNDEIDISKESLELMKDVANMRYVQNFVTLSPTIAQNIGTVNQNADVDYIMNAAGEKLLNEVTAGAEGYYS